MGARMGTGEVFVFWLLVLASVITALVMFSCWDLRWMSDDWSLLMSASESGWQLESRHVSLPRRLIFGISARADVGPWLPRVVAWSCLLVANLVLLPAIVRLLYPGWSRIRALSVGLGTLTLSTHIEVGIWPASCAYPVLLLWLHLLAWCHLRWLHARTPRWRVGSVLATCAGICTWELGIGAAPLVVALSVVRGRSVRRSLSDCIPHAAVVACYLALKLLVDSDDFPLSGPVRILGNAAYLPLLQLTPLPLTHGFLTSPGGAACALIVLVAVGLSAASMGRRGLALLAIPYLLLLPVLVGPGPAQRYLLLSAPWFVLILWARAMNTPGGLYWRRIGVSLLLLALPLHVLTSVRTVGDWRRAERAAVRIEEEVFRAARGADSVAALNVPDRLPGWGPTYTVPVFRNGLVARLALLGVDIAFHGNTDPVDPEILGFALNSPFVESDQLEAWRRRGVRVLDARPSWAALRGEAEPDAWVDTR